MRSSKTILNIDQKFFRISISSVEWLKQRQKWKYFAYLLIFNNVLFYSNCQLFHSSKHLYSFNELNLFDFFKSIKIDLLRNSVYDQCDHMLVSVVFSMLIITKIRTNQKKKKKWAIKHGLYSI